MMKDLELDMGFERADLQDDEENPKVDFKDYILPTKEELEQELRLPEEDLLSKLEKRMDDITFILKNSELYTFDNKSLREDFVDQYIADVFFSTKITKCAFKRLVELLGAGQTVDMLGTISDMSHTCICINHWKAQIGDVVADFRDNNVKYKRIFWCDDVFGTNVKKKKDLRRLASYKKAILRF